jgi:predicted phage terminase large subunit-like protein
VQSWDLSFKDGDGHDYVVGLVARRSGAQTFILDRFKAKVSFVDTLQAIRHMVAKYPETRTVLIEDAANGPAVVSVLHKEVPGILAVTPEGGKRSRAAAVQPQIEAGQVFLPRPRFPDGQLRFEFPWVEDFIEQCSMFPMGEHDDDVDALTQLLVYLQKRPGGLSDSEIVALMAEDNHDDEEDDRETRVGSLFKPPRCW